VLLEDELYYRTIDGVLLKCLDCPTATVTYQAPILPPVQAGAELGQLNVMCNEVVVQVTPLYAAEAVEEGDIIRKALDALKELTLGWLPTI
jgi:D-alanyl-D-alanine carboxypeptidase (penicillin-binding protein 5/6)